MPKRKSIKKRSVKRKSIKKMSGKRKSVKRGGGVGQLLEKQICGATKDEIKKWKKAYKQQLFSKPLSAALPTHTIPTAPPLVPPQLPPRPILPPVLPPRPQQENVQSPPPAYSLLPRQNEKIVSLPRKKKANK